MPERVDVYTFGDGTEDDDIVDRLYVAAAERMWFDIEIQDSADDTGHCQCTTCDDYEGCEHIGCTCDNDRDCPRSPVPGVANPAGDCPWYWRKAT
jgi:hypothetical protein